MRKLIIISILSLFLGSITTSNVLANPNDSLSKTMVYNDLKALYKDDVKSLVKFGYSKADTVIGKITRALSYGASESFDILVQQQRIKSIYYLFYWIISISLTISLVKIYKKYSDDATMPDKIQLITGIMIVADIVLIIMNYIHFNEMLTGFFNPKFGAIRDIIMFIK